VTQDDATIAQMLHPVAQGYHRADKQLRLLLEGVVDLRLCLQVERDDLIEQLLSTNF
jgi:hypothetical protein